MTTNNGIHVLYKDDNHSCISFTELVHGDGVQANQFLITHDDHAALLDPGGDLTYTPLTIEVSKHVDIKNLDYIFASHQDPDIIASLPRWMMHSHGKIVCSRLWSRFLPHLSSAFMSSQSKGTMLDRLIEVPDKGLRIPFGTGYIACIPAHFLHSVGNFQFYDSNSKILFSGDMGASMVDDHIAAQPVEDFQQHIASMKGFHQRYMCSNKATKLWADMVRGMDVEMLVPQHGRPFKGKAMINQFLDWISALPCGVDLLSAQNFTAPVDTYQPDPPEQEASVFS